MAAGPVNQALLESNFQSPGQIYDDAKTEGAFNVVAQQVNDNWFSQAALIDAVSGLVVGTQVIEQKMNFYRQALINGNLDVWQRATSFILGATSAYTADRWMCWRTGLTTGANLFQRTETTLVGSRYSAEIGRTNLNATVEPVNFAQALPTDDSVKLRGQQLTLSFSAIALVGFSAAGSTLTATVSYGTGTDQDAVPPITGQTTIGTAGFTLSTSAFQRYFLTTTVVPNTANQIFITFSYTPVGSASSTDRYKIAAINLCAGTVALPMQPYSYHEELESCQRYFIATFGDSYGLGQGIALSTTDARIQINLPKTMRVSPTFSVPAASDLQLTDGVSSLDVTSLSQITAETSPNLVTITAVTSGMTQFRAYQLKGDGGSSRRYFYNAEF